MCFACAARSRRSALPWALRLRGGANKWGSFHWNVLECRSIQAHIHLADPATAAEGRAAMQAAVTEDTGTGGLITAGDAGLQPLPPLPLHDGGIAPLVCA
eukprot:scaffold19159_cov112-Isochrysis_galbana.AAC.1